MSTTPEREALAQRVQANPDIAWHLLAACKAALPHFSGFKSLVGHQLQAAIACAQVSHVPQRPLDELLQREAEELGKVLGGASLEQGEPA